MDTIESLHERVEVLEHQIEALVHRSHVIERRLRWWCALACGLLVLLVASLPWPWSTAQDESSEYRAVRKRLAALEYKLQYVSGGPNEVVISGANLRIVNGLGSTETTNGLGNLIVGYNELRNDPGSADVRTGYLRALLAPDLLSGAHNWAADVRTGSHNIVMGSQNNFSSYGGLVVGLVNDISGAFASVKGGIFNIASGELASVSGGNGNMGEGGGSSISGGQVNAASGVLASVSGGSQNTASGNFSSVSGGGGNIASGAIASVSGGEFNTASGTFASVSGGLQRTAPALDNWAAGPLFAAN